MSEFTYPRAVGAVDEEVVSGTEWWRRVLQVVVLGVATTLAVLLGWGTLWVGAIAAELPAVGELVSAAGWDEQPLVPVKLQDISPYFIKAFVAAEGPFRRPGGGICGSVLAMRLGRDLLLTPTSHRSIKEMLLAHQIEWRYSQDEILEIYLNRVYFGGHAYGIGAASQVYFHCSPARLSLAQSALLAGIVPAPSAFSPLDNPKRAVARRNAVLLRMRESGAIGQGEFAEAVGERLNVELQGKSPEDA